ncbi:MAG: hypothetical protein IJR99_03140 [Kiritimatiellae bacterium]|nr:hypothetical protein [Kiritimatiellia bacterium]
MIKGSLEKHGKVYRARWMVDGKLYLRSTGTADRAAAEKKLTEFIVPFALGE